MLALHERRSAGSFTIKQTGKSCALKRRTIAHNLKAHAAHFAGIAASRAVIKRRNREKMYVLGS